MRAYLALAVLAPALLAGCAGPTDPADADGDGLSDEYERRPRDISVVLAGNSTLLSVTSDPNARDTDGDGLTDFEETAKATNPSDVDTDGDGLVDGRSLRLPASVLASKGLVTAAGDDELAVGEADACGSPLLNPANSDSDRPFSDGIQDGDELRGWDVTARGGTYHVTSDPCTPDSDSDGLLDGPERDRGCDPRDPDTDADGARDPVDVACDANVLVRVTLDRIAMKRNMDPVSGSKLRFVVQAGAEQREYRRDVAQPGTVQLGFSSPADVDDTSASPDRLEVALAVTVLHEDAVGGTTPVRVSGSSGTVEILYEAVAGTWSVGGRGGEGSGSVDGEDATLWFTIETEHG